MNTKIFEQFDVMTDAELAKVEGGGMEWIGDVLGAIGNAVEGGGCNWKGAAATVAVGAVGGAIKGAVTTY